MYIGSHVHLRDFGQKHKETIKHGLEVARDSGVDAVFDMPNTNPPIMTRDLVVDRLRLAKDADENEYWDRLKIKLKEEVDEFIQDSNKDEMADIFEVITAINSFKGWTIEEIVEVQKKKIEERGGFKDKIILNEVKE